MDLHGFSQLCRRWFADGEADAGSALELLMERYVDDTSTPRSSPATSVLVALGLLASDGHLNSNIRNNAAAWQRIERIKTVVRKHSHAQMAKAKLLLLSKSINDACNHSNQQAACNDSLQPSTSLRPSPLDLSAAARRDTALTCERMREVLLFASAPAKYNTTISNGHHHGVRAAGQGFVHASHVYHTAASAALPPPPSPPSPPPLSSFHPLLTSLYVLLDAQLRVSHACQRRHNDTGVEQGDKTSTGIPGSGSAQVAIGTGCCPVLCLDIDDAVITETCPHPHWRSFIPLLVSFLVLTVGMTPVSTREDDSTAIDGDGHGDPGGTATTTAASSMMLQPAGHTDGGLLQPRTPQQRSAQEPFAAAASACFVDPHDVAAMDAAVARIEEELQIHIAGPTPLPDVGPGVDGRTLSTTGGGSSPALRRWTLPADLSDTAIIAMLKMLHPPSHVQHWFGDQAAAAAAMAAQLDSCKSGGVAAPQDAVVVVVGGGGGGSHDRGHDGDRPLPFKPFLADGHAFHSLNTTSISASSHKSPKLLPPVECAAPGIISIARGVPPSSSADAASVPSSGCTADGSTSTMRTNVDGHLDADPQYDLSNSQAGSGGQQSQRSTSLWRRLCPIDTADADG